MFGPQFETLDQIQLWAFSSLSENGKLVAPRGMPTREIAPIAFTLVNPRARYVSLPRRRWSLPLAVGEFCWHAAGSDELDFISWYAPRWREFSDDCATIRGSCYGKRVFEKSDAQPNQWQRVTTTLQLDPASRRAVLYFDGPSDELRSNGRDFPCATSLQFLIRSDRLDAIVTMRSNDAVWGLPYDVFLFTMLQELMALELGIPVGEYHHISGSLHLYERHVTLSAESLKNSPILHDPMPPMRQPNQLSQFLQFEERIRRAPREIHQAQGLDEYWADLLSVVVWHGKAIAADNRAPQDPSAVVKNTLYRTLLELGESPIHSAKTNIHA